MLCRFNFTQRNSTALEQMCPCQHRLGFCCSLPHTSAPPSAFSSSFPTFAPSSVSQLRFAFLSTFSIHIPAISFSCSFLDDYTAADKLRWIEVGNGH